MVFGFEVSALSIEIGGLVLIVLFGITALLGWRGFKLSGLTPGRRLRVHKSIAIVAIAVALFHALMGFVYLNGWQIG